MARFLLLWEMDSTRIPEDLEEPWDERTPQVEAMQRVVGLHERVLESVAGVLQVAHQVKESTQELALMAREEILDGASLTRVDQTAGAVLVGDGKIGGHVVDRRLLEVVARQVRQQHPYVLQGVALVLGGLAGAGGLPRAARCANLAARR